MFVRYRLLLFLVMLGFGLLAYLFETTTFDKICEIGYFASGIKLILWYLVDIIEVKRE